MTDSEMTLEQCMKQGQLNMKEAIEHLQRELVKIRAGKANPSMLKGIMVDYYGTPTPINQVGNINAPDSRTLSIQPWDKKALADIERAIFEANLGVTPQNDGEFVRISIPPLTEERRVELVRQTKGLGEEAKVSLRSARHKMIDFIKKEVKTGYPEDAGKRKEKEVQDLLEAKSKEIESILQVKEEDIMKV